MTTGSKNTILGRYSGNADGLDIRTSSNNVVLSDGDGNVKFHFASDDDANFRGNVYVPDAKDLNIGNGSGGYGDIIIMHDPDSSRGIGGSNTTGTNYFFCETSNTVFMFDGNEMHFTDSGPGIYFGYGSLMVSGVDNSFYAGHNNSLKFQTTNTGIKVTGGIIATSGDIQITGSSKSIGSARIGLRYQTGYNNFGSIYPYDITNSANNDDTTDLGQSNARFDDVYATNGTIQTSDQDEKQDFEALSEAEKRVAVAAKGLLKKFRWKSAVAEKGDNARIHFVIVAQ